MTRRRGGDGDGIAWLVVPMVVAVVVAIVLIPIGDRARRDLEPSPGPRETPRTPPVQFPAVVAHALGVPDGSDRTYCNCREGFEASYRDGFRAFEVDVALATDGVPIAYHGGQAERLGLRTDAEVLARTSSEFLELEVDGRFATLDGWELLDLLEGLDFVLFLHTKFGSYTEIPAWFLDRASAEARTRIVPYVWREAQLRELQPKGGSIFVVPAHDHLGMSVDLAASFAIARGLAAVVGDEWKFSDRNLARLHDAGVATFADRGYREVADEREAELLRGRLDDGFYGVYSDRTPPRELLVDGAVVR